METDALSGSVESRAVVRRSTCDVGGRLGGRCLGVWEGGCFKRHKFWFGMVCDQRGRLSATMRHRRYATKITVIPSSRALHYYYSIVCSRELLPRSFLLARGCLF